MRSWRRKPTPASMVPRQAMMRTAAATSFQFAPGVTGPISLTTINDSKRWLVVRKKSPAISRSTAAQASPFKPPPAASSNVVGASAHLMLSHVDALRRQLYPIPMKGGAILIGAGATVDVKNSKLSGNKSHHAISAEVEQLERRARRAR